MRVEITDPSHRHFGETAEIVHHWIGRGLLCRRVVLKGSGGIFAARENQFRRVEMPTLKARVEEALENAAVNGYSFVATADPEEVARDLVQCYSEVEGEEPLEVAPHVEAWQRARNE